MNKVLAHTVNISLDAFQNLESKDFFFEDIDREVDLEPLIDRLKYIIEDKLSPREREIIKYLYGFDQFEKLTVSAIALHLGLSRGTVTYYIKRAFNKFNKEFRKSTLYYDSTI